ncbi:MAG: redoxin domain-containing protein [Armatimonadetes bacterium]|nr:redoxin domain-containing protein [Armatimonadota bacterium]
MTPLLALTAVLASGPIEVGQMVPDVTLTDMDGKAVRLSEFRGKKVILFTWASW